MGLMFVYFWFAEVGDERCVIDGRSYSGYEAVQMNKKITEEYAGTVTDEKINQIVDKYELPSELNENMPGWKNGNYLNDFVTRFFTNGSWDFLFGAKKQILISAGCFIGFYYYL